ncbi:protein REPRESSOR OF SILENCING 3 isoform X1 [Primulina tabacum]|uniref:protein REPRESSOR OF SILENCING 3 isoform X1 n=1 Tax=Primulina tabacum TaxID=48773 RepID=UPI003F5A23A4
MGEKMRIYIGGLGATVMEGDLRKTFSSPVLGTVESVEIIRSKGRSFAYLDFIPASEKGLAKLFSTYNGCMWKGGRLKLEKAKEHYLFRLRREWTKDNDIGKKLPDQNVCADVNLHTWQTTKKNLDIEQMHLRIYFPKLRKIKPLPFKGSGKHKYSFQRVEVPPLPVHFCDCEEHSVPLKLAEKKFGIYLDTETCGVNEEELNMVKSVLNKFLERENRAKPVSNVIEFTEKTYTSISSVDNVQVHGYEDDQVSDEDGLVINIISHPRNRVSLVKNRGQEHELRGSKKSMHAFGKKRKTSVSMDDANVMPPYERKMRKQGSQDHVGDLRIDVTTRPAEIKSGSAHLTDGVALSKKSAWRDLVNQKGSAIFHISDVLTNHNPPEVASSSKKEMRDNRSSTDRESEKVPDIQSVKMHDVEDMRSSTDKESEKVPDIQPVKLSDVEDMRSSTDKESEKVPDIQPVKLSDVEDMKSSTYKESEKVPDIQPIKPSDVEDMRSSRGAAWLQKSSWLQLVGDTTNRSFNLAQILPESQRLYGNDVSSSTNKNQQIPVPNNRNHPVEDIGKPREKADSDTVIIAPKISRITSLDALTKVQNHTSLDEQEDASSPATNKVPARVPMPVPDIVISDTCPFMRSAASMKEWTKVKATLSARKKKEKLKENE